MDPPGTFTSPEKMIKRLSITSQSPIASAKSQKRSAAVEKACRRIFHEDQPEPEGEPALEGPVQKEEVLFSPAFSRLDEDESSDSERSREHVVEKKHVVVHEPAEKDDPEFDFCPYRFIKSLPRVDTISMSRPPVLPIKHAKYHECMTLVLDLDETLVHCSVDPLENSELTFPVVHCGQEYQVHVRRRPFFKEFCEKVSEWFEVVIFTASQRVYADRLLDILDPEGTYFQHRLFRDHCHYHDGNYLKDLRVLNRDLSRVAIIDNSVQAFGLHLDNGIPVESWFSEDCDSELMRLIPFLQGLRNQNDVRPHIRRQFRLQEVVNSL